MNLHLVTSDTSTAWIMQAYEIHVEAQFAPWKFTTFEDCLTPPYYCVFAVENEIVVGYAIMLEVLDEATLMDIAVKQECRGRGIGDMLLKQVLALSLHNSMVEVWLEVRESNESAIALYEKHGFYHIEIRKNYYPLANGKENAVIMKWEKPL